MQQQNVFISIQTAIKTHTHTQTHNKVCAIFSASLFAGRKVI